MTLERARAVAERGVSRGAYLRVDLAVSRGGAEPSGFRINPNDADQLWTCASKCLLAVGMARLVSDGRLGYDDTLGRYLPGLSDGGWRGVRLRDVLSHSVAVRADVAALSVTCDDPEVLRRLAAVSPDPDGTPAYTTWTSSFLAGQVMARVTGESHRSYLLREVMIPLGLRDTSLIYPATRLPELRRAVRPLIEGACPARLSQDGPVQVREDRAWAGVSGTGPMRDLVRVLSALVPGRSGRGREGAIVRPKVAAEVTAVHRPGRLAAAGGDALSWGLGVAVDSRLAGPGCSAGTFGHFGQDGSVLVFADPDQDVVAGLCLSGAGTGPRAVFKRAALVAAMLDDIRSAAADS